MASSFDYTTGRCTFDFHLKKSGVACNRNFLPRTRIGNEYCARCKHYKGEVDDFVCCSYHDKDDEGASFAWDKLRQSLRHQALCALCD
ncbi:MAG: hypothetical protein Q4A15_04585 [Prevotellaceae bacterium]|nr:hypothetical protein [Prevotellaceae bacterium]